MRLIREWAASHSNELAENWAIGQSSGTDEMKRIEPLPVKAPYAIKAAEQRRDFVLFVTFSDGTSREIDFEPFFRIPMSIETFRSFEIDEEAGTLVWPNGRDIAPDMLYYGLKPAWMEEKEARLAKKRAG